ncbi:MAG: hypothetical protein ABJF23_24655 [Bryobacteraceae bacterium]
MLFSGTATATTITSTFDTNLEGWTTNPQGTIAFVSTDGNPGGYLEETDASSTGNMHVTAPAKFLGDLTWATNLSVDIRVSATPGSVTAAFGTLTFLNSAAALSVAVDLGTPSTVWTNYSTALNAAAFGVSAATYSAVMSNVTSITLILEADRNSDTEKVGIDNFTIFGGTSVPEPSPFALVAPVVLLGLVIRKAAVRA